MKFHKEIWTYLIVTIVAVLIWFWAAGETRDDKTISYARIEFAVTEPEDWIIYPRRDFAVTLSVEGSQLALQNVERLLRLPLEVPIKAEKGRRQVELLERLQMLDEIRVTGVNLTAVQPATIELEMDQIERLPARVKATMPGTTTEGEVQVEPAEVTVALPSNLRSRVPQPLFVEAFIGRSELDRLAPGERHIIEAPLRMPENFPLSSDVHVTPATAKVSFTIRSRTRETKLDAVRVQLAGAPENLNAYSVHIEPSQIQNVTITADADLIRRIENPVQSERATVVALVHVKFSELGPGSEWTIEKRIAYFAALVPDDNGGTRGQSVDAKIDGSSERPVVTIKIVKR